MEQEEPFHKGFLLIPPDGPILMQKSWQQKHCLLFKASKFGTKRLEIYDTIDSKESELINLEDCMKVHLKSMTVLCVTTKSEAYEFGALTKQSLEEWLNAFQTVCFPDECFQTTEEDNDHYSISDEALFNVKLWPSPASERCRLQRRNYILLVTATALQLKNISDDRLLFIWPYKYIRRYGFRSGKFTFEAGRKCESGEGLFLFDHPNREDIFRCVKSKMNALEKPGESSSVLESSNVQIQAAANTEATSPTPIPLSPTSPSTPDPNLIETELDHPLKPAKPAVPPKPAKLAVPPKSAKQATSPTKAIVPKPPLEIPKPPLEIPKPPLEIPKPPLEIPKPPLEIPKPPLEIPKPPLEIPKPSLEIAKPLEKAKPLAIPKPPLEIPKPPLEIPKPALEIPEPPSEIAKPLEEAKPLEIPKPPLEIPKPPSEIAKPLEKAKPLELPKPPLEIPKPPLEIPKPPLEIPKPPLEIPKPPLEIPKPPLEIPNPPLHIPKPSLEIPKPPLDIPKPPSEIRKPSSQLPASSSDQDYEIIGKPDDTEVRNKTWQTLSLNIPSHSKQKSKDDEPKHLSLEQVKREFEDIKSLAPDVAAQSSTTDSGDTHYHKLSHFGPINKLKTESGYKQVSPLLISPRPYQRPSSVHDEVQCLAAGPVRSADDSHLGSAVIQKVPSPDKQKDNTDGGKRRKDKEKVIWV